MGWHVVTNTVATRLVVVVDDDISVRESLPPLLRELGYEAIAFASAEELLSSLNLALVECLVLDVGLPGLTGPALRDEILSRGRCIPTIFITGRSEWNLPPCLQSDRAVHSLLKPFDARQLRSALDAVMSAPRG